MTFPLETLEQMQVFFWVLVRVSILFFMLPLFGARGIPALWKGGLSMIMAIVLTPLLPSLPDFPETLSEMFLGVIGELILALILVIIIKMIFSSVEMAGQFMSFQMGFAMARAVDPQTGAQSTVLTQFLYLFTILIFLSIDGHHLFIRALAASFRIVPPNSLSFDNSIADVIIRISSNMFLYGIKIAAPIMVSLFLSNLCLGIIARTVPQVNILMVGFPVNLSIGLILFSLILRNVYPLLQELIKDMGELLIRLIHLM
ncbi:MAG: flagellar type III secretion system protein FliR [Deltaproteobacteria bacterium]|nr:flagellar type III secretion system protein FliR [Deltaproteobacteria bacterium]